MRLDLREDIDAVRGLVRSGLDRFAGGSAPDRSGSPPVRVSRVDLVYTLGDGSSPARAMVHVDTEADAEPDGSWSHMELAEADFPRWREPSVALSGGVPVEVLGGAGAAVVAKDRAAFETAVGEFLRDCLIGFRDDAMFADLPTHPGAELGVEALGGGFGWPAHRERRTDNLLVPSARASEGTS